MQLADGTVLGTREGLEHFHMAQHRERNRDDRVVAGRPRLLLSSLDRRLMAPGAKPDFFGYYAWSAGQLFAKVHKDVGAKITRKGFLAAIKSVHSWSANGLHVSHDIGNKLISPCFLYLEVKNEAFRRLHPSSGFECGMGGLVNT